MRKPRLVDNWRDWPTWASSWFGTALAVWLATPEATQAAVLSTLGVPPATVPAVLLGGIMVGRIWKQAP